MISPDRVLLDLLGLLPIADDIGL